MAGTGTLVYRGTETQQETRDTSLGRRSRIVYRFFPIGTTLDDTYQANRSW